MWQRENLQKLYATLKGAIERLSSTVRACAYGVICHFAGSLGTRNGSSEKCWKTPKSVITDSGGQLTDPKKLSNGKTEDLLRRLHEMASSECKACGSPVENPPLCEECWSMLDAKVDGSREEYLPVIVKAEDETTLAVLRRDHLGYATKLSMELITRMSKEEYIMLNPRAIDALLDDIRQGMEKIERGEYQ